MIHNTRSPSQRRLMVPDLICRFVALCVLTIVTGSDESDRHLLDAVSEKYESLGTYEFKGHEVGVLSGDNCEIDFEFQVSRDSTAPSLESPTILFHPPKVSKPCAAQRFGFITAPGLWADFSTIGLGVKNIHELSAAEISLSYPNSGHDVVLEVQYDEYNQRVRNITGPVRYWIDPKTDLIRHLELSEKVSTGVQLWRVDIDEIDVVRKSPQNDTSVQSELVGRIAPGLELRTSDGEKVELASLRGKVIVLAFWATWCTPCEIEIPRLEELQRKTNPSEVVVFGITEESSIIVGAWLEKYRRTFRTLVDAKAAFEAFRVQTIPLLVVIDRKGTVAHYVLGIQSERQIQHYLANASALPL
jgi:peroxiredoxin